MLRFFFLSLHFATNVEEKNELNKEILATNYNLINNIVYLPIVICFYEIKKLNTFYIDVKNTLAELKKIDYDVNSTVDQKNEVLEKFDKLFDFDWKNEIKTIKKTLERHYDNKDEEQPIFRFLLMLIYNHMFCMKYGFRDVDLCHEHINKIFATSFYYFGNKILWEPKYELLLCIDRKKAKEDVIFSMNNSILVLDLFFLSLKNLFQTYNDATSTDTECTCLHKNDIERKIMFPALFVELDEFIEMIQENTKKLKNDKSIFRDTNFKALFVNFLLRLNKEILHFMYHIPFELQETISDDEKAFKEVIFKFYKPLYIKLYKTIIPETATGLSQQMNIKTMEKQGKKELDLLNIFFQEKYNNIIQLEEVLKKRVYWSHEEKMIVYTFIKYINFLKFGTYKNIDKLFEEEVDEEENDK